MTGNYVVAVEGLIEAAGTAGDSILFVPHIAGTTWGHIEIPAGADGGSSFAYCRITGADARDNVGYSTDGGGLMVGAFVGVTINNCVIAWCAADHGGGLYIGSGSVAENSGIHHCQALSAAVQSRAVASTCKAARAC